jgi:hypothetical protein
VIRQRLLSAPLEDALNDGRVPAGWHGSPAEYS